MTAQRKRENALLRANGWKALDEYRFVEKDGKREFRWIVLRSLVAEAAQALVVLLG